MPRKTHKDKQDRRGSRRSLETRTPRPKPKIDFTAEALDYKNTNLLRQYVTDQGRILPRKYSRRTEQPRSHGMGHGRPRKFPWHSWLIPGPKRAPHIATNSDRDLHVNWNYMDSITVIPFITKFE